MGDDDNILQWETEHFKVDWSNTCILIKNLQGGGQMGALSFSSNDFVGMMQIRVQIMDDNWMTDVKLYMCGDKTKIRITKRYEQVGDCRS